MSELLVADFKNARIGDRVKTVYGFEGKIIKKTNWSDATKQRWVMEFEQLNGGDLSFEFNDDGYSYSHGYKYSKLPVVFYHFEGQFPTIEACTRPLPTIEVDEKILCYMNDEWLPRYFYDFEDGEMFVFENGRTDFSSNGSYDGCKYWMLADDPTINSGNLEEIEE